MWNVAVPGFGGFIHGEALGAVLMRWNTFTMGKGHGVWPMYVNSRQVQVGPLTYL